MPACEKPPAWRVDVYSNRQIQYSDLWQKYIHIFSIRLIKRKNLFLPDGYKASQQMAVSN